MGTEEDGDTLFRKFARHHEKLDDDFTMDDLVVDRLARKQNKAKEYEKERSKAVAGMLLKLVNSGDEGHHHQFPSLSSLQKIDVVLAHWRAVHTVLTAIVLRSTFLCLWEPRYLHMNACVGGRRRGAFSFSFSFLLFL